MIRAELLVSSRATASPSETVPDSWLSILLRSSSGLTCANLCVRARHVEATRLWNHWHEYPKIKCVIKLGGSFQASYISAGARWWGCLLSHVRE